MKLDLIGAAITEITLAKMGVLVKFDQQPGLAIIDCPEEENAMVIFTKLGAAVKAWNADHNKTLKQVGDSLVVEHQSGEPTSRSTRILQSISLTKKGKQ